jgi:hypothetical protein
MSRAVCVTVTCLGAASMVASCASAPVQTASGYADQSAHAVYRTGSDVYAGVGTAAKRPFQDLNMMQDPIPIVLLRAELDPYSVKGLTSCDVIMNHVAELDLALGPDLDTPADHPKSKVTEDAGLAAAAALEAAAAAAEGFMPVRSVVKRVSGASKYEAHVKHAILAGTERRTFLKAIGVMHACSWPAAPLTVSADEAKIVTAWGPAIVASPLNAVVQVNAPASSVAAAKAGPVPSAAVQPVTVPAATTLQTASLAPPRSVASAPTGSALGESLRTTPQAVAQPAALVGAPSGDPASSGAYTPAPAYQGPAYPGAAPWASPPPGAR